MPEELLGMGCPLLAGGEVACPGEDDLLKDPLGHLGRQGSVLRCGLQEVVELGVPENRVFLPGACRPAA
jgi:hypothetical protein